MKSLWEAVWLTGGHNSKTQSSSCLSANMSTIIRTLPCRKPLLLGAAFPLPPELLEMSAMHKLRAALPVDQSWSQERSCKCKQVHTHTHDTLNMAHGSLLPNMAGNRTPRCPSASLITQHSWGLHVEGAAQRAACARPGDSDWSENDWWLQLIHSPSFPLLLDLRLFTL